MVRTTGTPEQRTKGMRGNLLHLTDEDYGCTSCSRTCVCKSCPTICRHRKCGRTSCRYPTVENRRAREHCDEIIKEVEVQEKEHPWLTRTQLYRLANDHVNIKHSGGKSHG